RPTRPFLNLVSVNPGFDPRRLLAADMTLRGANYDTTQKVATFYRLALERMRRSPSIASAAVILNPPMTRGMNIVVTTLDPKSDGQLKLTDWRYITSDYFTVVGTPLSAGRAFPAPDPAGGPRVFIVTETFARKSLSGETPIGLQIIFGGGSRKPVKADSIATIVGLAPDMKQESLGEQPLPIVYTPLE